MKPFERRTITVDDMKVEYRANGDGKMPVISGHAALFDELSVDMGFREKIAPGAFTRTLGEGADVRALFNHDPNLVLGRTSSGTLELREDDKGLFMFAIPPDTQTGRDVVELIERGDITQQSFAFRTVTDEWRMADGVDIRTLIDVDLIDVSPVTYPAYLATDIGIRSHGDIHAEGIMRMYRPDYQRRLDLLRARV